jgi:hypothetical protein
MIVLISCIDDDGWCISDDNAFYFERNSPLHFVLC